MARKIIHVDMDCFYAAVEIKFRPELRGRPVAVGGSPEGRGGVLTTANYEARQFGVRSAMTSAKALKLCPQLILISPDFSKYKVESRKVRSILERYSRLVEPLSLDEAYLDVSNSDFEQGSATRIAEKIRRDIETETGLTASAGVAPNKFLAKIASDLNKPNGLKVIRPGDVDAFMKTLPISKIWGVGRVTSEKMRRMGLETCGDLQRFSVSQLVEIFGSFGPQLYDFSRGIDFRPVRNDRLRKSLSVEETYSRSLKSRNEAHAALVPIYADFLARMEKHRNQTGADDLGPRAEIKSVVVKVKFDDFRQKGRERKWTASYFDGQEPARTSAVIKTRTEDALPSLQVFSALLDEALDGETLNIRLLGLGVRFSSAKSSSRTAATSQLSLLD